jgi:hypothetical protein
MNPEPANAAPAGPAGAEPSPAPASSPEPAQEGLRTRLARQLLLTLVPCGAALDLGATEDDRLSTSESTQAEEEVALDHLERLGDQGKLERALALYRDLHQEEEARKAGAESRLSTVLGMSSVVSAITLAAVSMAVERRFLESLGAFGIGATVLFLFAVAQLVISVWHALRGLYVRLYSEAAGTDVLPRPGEGDVAFLVRRLRTYSELVQDHDANNSDKTRRLVLAHRALLNFLGAVLLLVGLLAVASWLRPPRDDGAALAARLRADPALVELLRGPRGEPGPPGPAGPSGPAGPPGRDTACPPAGRPR